MYFSFWYKPSERALRIGIFHAANALASGVGGFIAVGVDKINGAGGLESWRCKNLIPNLLVSWACRVGPSRSLCLAIAKRKPISELRQNEASGDRW